MRYYTPTPILFVREFKTGRDTQETSFKGLIKEKLAADVRAGKHYYTLDEIYKIFAVCYSLAGSTSPVKTAKSAWTDRARPGKETWFI